MASYDDILLKNIKNNYDNLTRLLENIQDEWGYEDYIYRYWHGSFKVYWIQRITLQIVDALKQLDPGFGLNAEFLEIIEEGTGKTFEFEHNKNWAYHTRPMLNAFFHAKFFLEMIVKYGKELEEAPTLLPSGWAAVLYLYEIR